MQSAIADAVRKELEALGALELGAAQIALGIAEQLDSRQLVGAAYVSLSKELDRRMDALRLMVPRSDDPVEVIRRRFDEKRSHLKLADEPS